MEIANCSTNPGTSESETNLAQLTGGQISTLPISSLSEEIRAATDVSNGGVPFCYLASVSELFKNKERRTLLSYSNSSLNESNTEHHGFLYVPMEDNVQGISQNDENSQIEMLPLPEISVELCSEFFHNANFLGLKSGFSDNEVRCISQNAQEIDGVSAMAKTSNNKTFDFCNNRNFLVSELFENKRESTILNYSKVYSKGSSSDDHGFLYTPMEDNVQGISQNNENSPTEISPQTEVFNNKKFLGKAGMFSELIDNEDRCIPQNGEGPNNQILAPESTFSYKSNDFCDNRNFPVSRNNGNTVAWPSKSEVHCRKNDKRFVCDICQKSFTRKITQETHMRSHTDKKTNDCDICLKKFTQSYYLERHLRLHTGQKPYDCDICRRQFGGSDHLEIPRRNHTVEKPYDCDICRKRFNQSSNVTQHKRIHTRKKPYGCDICGKGFTRSSSVTQHLLIHTGKKQYCCDICGKIFFWSSDLEKHQRIHTGEKPYGCDICGKRFTQSSQVIGHQRIHTGEKPYGCDICGKRFNQSSTATQHKRIHTG